jgi:hypothetical protein
MASWFALLCLMLSISACTTKQINPQVNPEGKSQNVSLQEGDLRKYGMSLITPSAVITNEQDKQAMALVFAGVFNEEKPDVPLTTLTETLGLVNSNGLTDEYQKMFKDYQDTGIFNIETLKKIGELTGSRYIAQLKLADFSQQSHGRFSAFGLRLMKTQWSNIRLFLTIWNSHDGRITWEGMQELSYAYDTFTEKPVSFKQAVEEASLELINRLPGNEPSL